MWVVLLALSFLSSTIYISVPDLPVRWAVKAFSIAILIPLVRRRPLVALALTFGATGDALLALRWDLFLPGLVAFLIGHLFYTAHFIRQGAGRFNQWLIYGVLAYGSVVFFFLRPHLGPLVWPVHFYLLVILALVIFGSRLDRLTLLGALLFMVSDTILAYNRFATPIPLAGYLVWTTYYAAQLLLSGWWRDLPQRAPATAA